MRTWIKVSGLLLVAFALNACSGWLIGETERLPTWQLPDVAAVETGNRDHAALASRLVVLTPQAPPTLNGLSPVVVNPTGALSVVGAARWADRPAAMLQQRLRDHLAASGHFADVSVESYRPADEQRLFIALHAFHVRMDENGELEALGDWSLRMPQLQLSGERIVVRKPVDGKHPEAIIRALQAVAVELLEQSTRAVTAMQMNKE